MPVSFRNIKDSGKLRLVFFAHTSVALSPVVLPDAWQQVKAEKKSGFEVKVSWY